MSSQPLPLHAFLPAQSWPAPPQAPWPLQALTPSQCTVLLAGVFALCSCAMAPLAMNKPATAVAMTAPFTWFFM